MTTQPTPEQIKKWREDAEAIWTKDHTLNSPYPKQHFIEGYLRAKQETEQAMKLAKFGAMILSNYQGGYVSDTEIGAAALTCECIMGLEENNKFAPNIEATIKRLLND